MRGHKFIANALWILCFPLSLAWALFTTLRRKHYPRKWRYQSRLSVLSVGNLHSGGSGKTPIVAALAARFQSEGAVVVSRGYRGSLSKSGAKVDLANASGPKTYGDEPWMLACQYGIEVWIGKDRTRTLQQLEATHPATRVILDDGFQHLAVGRNVDLVLINTSRALSESYCLPLGDLREPLSALAEASAVVLVSTAADEFKGEWEAYLTGFHSSLPVFSASKQLKGLWDGEVILPLASETSVGGFCGLSSPAGFEADLRTLPGGVMLRSLPNHHVYGENDVADILEKKRRARVQRLVTTDKDWDKTAPLFAAHGERLLSLRIGYEFPDAFWYFLQNQWVIK